MSIHSISNYERTYIKSTPQHLNPRQQEIWEMQNEHQSRLNYLSWKARLEGRMPTPSHPQTTVEIVECSEEDAGLIEEEKMLIETLEHEKELLQKAKSDVNQHLQRLEHMLDDFRKKRTQKEKEARIEALQYQKACEDQISKLRLSQIQDNSDFHITVREESTPLGFDCNAASNRK